MREDGGLEQSPSSLVESSAERTGRTERFDARGRGEEHFDRLSSASREDVLETGEKEDADRHRRVGAEEV